MRVVRALKLRPAPPSAWKGKVRVPSTVSRRLGCWVGRLTGSRARCISDGFTRANNGKAQKVRKLHESCQPGTAQPPKGSRSLYHDQTHSSPPWRCLGSPCERRQRASAAALAPSFFVGGFWENSADGWKVAKNAQKPHVFVKRSVRFCAVTQEGVNLG